MFHQSGTILNEPTCCVLNYVFRFLLQVLCLTCIQTLAKSGLSSMPLQELRKASSRRHLSTICIYIYIFSYLFTYITSAISCSELVQLASNCPGFTQACVDLGLPSNGSRKAGGQA